MQRVCACGKLIAGKHYLCKECEDIYGTTRAEWPEWLRFQLNDMKREEMAERTLCDREICFSDIDKKKRASLLDTFDEDGLLILRT